MTDLLAALARLAPNATARPQPCRHGINPDACQRCDAAVDAAEEHRIFNHGYGARELDLMADGAAADDWHGREAR